MTLLDFSPLTGRSLSLTAVFAVSPFIGSFAANAIVRSRGGLDFVWGRSCCPSCENALPPWHMVPVISFALLRGRCGSCDARISLYYPVVEAAFAVVTGWALLAAPVAQELPTVILGWLLVALAVCDALYLVLPNTLTLALACAGLLLGFTESLDAGLERLTGLIAASGFLLLIAEVYKTVRHRDGLGGGDIKLFGAAGAWLAIPVLPASMMIACASGLWYALTLSALGRTGIHDMKLPFGVFLALGIWLTWLYGPVFS